MNEVRDQIEKKIFLPNGQYNLIFLRRFAMAFVCFLTLVIILSANFFSFGVDLKPGEVSDRDIVAPRTTSYIDSVKTKQLEEEVRASVANVYDLDVNIARKIDEQVEKLFASLTTAAAEAPQSRSQQVEAVQSVTTLDANTIDSLLSLGSERQSVVKEESLALLHRYLQRGVQEDELELMKKALAAEVDKLSVSETEKNLIASIAQANLAANVMLNEEETHQRIQAAIASTEPVRGLVQKGQILVRHGEIVTEQQVSLMTELGLYHAQTGFFHLLGLSLLILLIMWLLLGYLRKFNLTMYRDDRQLFLLLLIIFGAVLLGKAIHYYEDFLMPMAVGSLLISILIGLRVGLFGGTALSFFYCIIADYDVSILVMAMLGNAVAVYNISKLASGHSLTRTGIMLALTNFVIMAAFGIIQEQEAAELLRASLLSMGGGLLSAVITMGLLPYLENAFRITTPLKLIELGQSNHPLMQRLLLEAPGTHHHGLVVANLAEAAANEVGADAILVRVGAYYHDVGKMRRPGFFVENQFGGENPHDKIAPTLSTRIIISHVRDGVELCKEYGLPQPIIDIVQQHHGTMLMSFFYRKAGENGAQLIETDFRYDGPRPQSKEAALVMLADSCEAAVRSLGKPNKGRIETMVRKLIHTRLEEGQLDECDLTLRDLTIVGDVYIRLLSSMFHSRIEYPDTKDLAGGKKQHANRNEQSAGDHADHRSDAGEGDRGIGGSGTTARTE